MAYGYRWFVLIFGISFGTLEVNNLSGALHGNVGKQAR